MVSTKDQVIDGESFKCMNEDTLKTLMPLAGPRLKLMDRIKKLNAQESLENNYCSSQSVPSGSLPTVVIHEDEPLVADKGETSGTGEKRLGIIK